jgi:hypothetical protein
VREGIRVALCELDESAWFEAMAQDIEGRKEAQVAELTQVVDLSSWPQGTP